MSAFRILNLIMTIMNHVAHGVMGTVYVTPKYAKKVISITDLSWTKELVIMLQLKPFHVETLAIPKHYSFIEEEGQKKLLFIMESCNRSMNLFDCNNKKIYQMLLDISHALMFLHKQGIIHRDVKENNILIKRNRFLLADFSHSTMNTNLSRNDIDIITEPYRPPEYYINAYIKTKTNKLGSQTNASNYQSGYYTLINEKADIWSLGIVLLNVMLGEFWFREKELSTVAEIGYFIKYKFNNWLDKQLPKFNDQILASLLSGMLHPDPAHRLNASQVYNTVTQIVQMQKIVIKYPAEPQMTLSPPILEFYANIDLLSIIPSLYDPLDFIKTKNYGANHTAIFATIIYILDNGFFRELTADPADSTIKYNENLFNNRAEFLEALPNVLSFAFMFMLESSVYDNTIHENYMTELIFDYLHNRVTKYKYLENKIITYQYAKMYKKLCYNYILEIFVVCGQKLFIEKRIDFNKNYSVLWSMFKSDLDKQIDELKLKEQSLKNILQQMRKPSNIDFQENILGGLFD